MTSSAAGRTASGMSATSEKTGTLHRVWFPLRSNVTYFEEAKRPAREQDRREGIGFRSTALPTLSDNSFLDKQLKKDLNFDLALASLMGLPVAADDARRPPDPQGVAGRDDDRDPAYAGSRWGSTRSRPTTRRSPGQT